MSPEDVIEDILSEGYAIVSFEETTGKASLEFKSWKGDTVSEKPTDKPKKMTEYRRLREEFPPVTAGVNFHKKFAAGGGLRVQIDDPRDDHQQEARDKINDLNRQVYQDYYTKGLDRILNVLVDEALTVGASAAEIVYEKEFKFIDFVAKIEEIPNPDTPDKPTKIIVTRTPKTKEWESFKGIKKLKIISNAIERLTPHRHPLTYWPSRSSGLLLPYLPLIEESLRF